MVERSLIARKASIMVKRLKALSEKQASSGSGLFDSQIAQSVKDSAQQIWLAGMGAFAKAQAEGGKVFEALVREGVSLQRKTQSAAEDKISEVTNRMSNMAGDISGKATQHWDKLETIFEERVAKALNRLGVPSAKDVDALMKRIDALSASVAKLSGAPVAKKAAPSKRASRPAAKPAAKPAVKRSARRSSPA
jgi:poly(hydroxyalkanoate) granule-associated protein